MRKDTGMLEWELAKPRKIKEKMGGEMRPGALDHWPVT